jgi:hypothetical protein
LLALLCVVGVVLGAFSTLDNGTSLLWAMFVGGSFGTLLGLVFGGAEGRWLESIFGKEEPEEGRE